MDRFYLAAVAAFFVLKLRNVLGKRTGNEQRSRFDPFKRKGEEAGDENVVQLPDRSETAEEPVRPAAGEEPQAAEVPLKAALTQIKLADSSFDQDEFLDGGKMAFEMVVTAFAQGDSDALRPLLADDVYDNFTGAIKERNRRNESLETTLVGINQAEIIEAALRQKIAFVTVKFVSEQVNVTRDKSGEVVDGDPSHVARITDIWTFARNTRSRDPNWTLVETRSPN